MAELILKNLADLAGTYSEESVIFSTNQVSTRIVTGITAVKSADKDFWIGGPLKYTVVISNNSGEDLTDVTFTDALDTSLITLDTTYGVYVNDVLSTTYTFAGGTVSDTIPLIATGGTATVVFQVLQI